MDLVIQTVAKNAIGESRGGSVGFESPADDRRLRGASGIFDILTDDGRQLLSRAGQHVGNPIQNGDFGCLDHRGGKLFVTCVDDKLSQGLGGAHRNPQQSALTNLDGAGGSQRY